MQQVPEAQGELILVSYLVWYNFCDNLIVDLLIEMSISRDGNVKMEISVKNGIYIAKIHIFWTLFLRYIWDIVSYIHFGSWFITTDEFWPSQLKHQLHMKHAT